METAVLLASVVGVLAGIEDIPMGDVVAYWGQSPSGQQSLATYCANTNVDVIPMAFLYKITTGPGGEPVIDFANQDDTCTMFDGTGLRICPDIGKDIATCQEEHGKTILLSIGGATYDEGGFSSEDAATAAAGKLWAMFGPAGDDDSVPRPFGDTVIDGFDFDFESPSANMAPFASELRSLMDTDSSKQYFLTAAPQCPFPDQAMDEMLSGGVPFDAVFVQFYNNKCGLDSFIPGGMNQSSFNYATWDRWAKETSANPDVRILLGVPAASNAASTGYLPLASLEPVIEYCKRFSSFGGIMTWDVSMADASEGFLEGIKGSLMPTMRHPLRMWRSKPESWYRR